ncbi:hypothetical protein [Roseomonas indoligenes]|uniref:Uncharacterized protein n=1 Tax=Roseomonas indoligenes TaxID=2820811 RepID=A0A940S7B0_9PROT|nr:hypothetical protein [Pararoseomonas indoligenes]MBP0492897.1 hypothetical protein [Pararoseomonas indoligenes]
MTLDPDQSWPAETMRTVGRAWRAAAGEGKDPLPCVEAAEAAFLAAGGRAEDPRQSVLAIVAHLVRDHGDWMCGPREAWLSRNRRPEPDPWPSIFDPPETVG